MSGVQRVLCRISISKDRAVEAKRSTRRFIQRKVLVDERSVARRRRGILRVLVHNARFCLSKTKFHFILDKGNLTWRRRGIEDLISLSKTPVQNGNPRAIISLFSHTGFCLSACCKVHQACPIAYQQELADVATCSLIFYRYPF